jgi:hypothetical protein
MLDAGDILGEVERFLKRTGMVPSHFGRACLGDPRFVFDLRKTGRNLRPKTAEKVRAFIKSQEEKSE